MRKPLFFLLFILSVEREVGGIVPLNQHVKDGIKYLVRDVRRNKRFFEDDPLEEEDTKWNIDLADMLNFDRTESDVKLDGKELSKEELNELVRRSPNEKKPGGETGGNYGNVKGKEDANALMYQDEDENFKTQIQEYVLRYVNLFLNLLNLQDKKGLEEDDEEVVDFNFVIAGKDLKTLQELSKNPKDRNILDQLYVIDSIISKGIRVKPKYSFYQDIMGVLSKAEFPREFFLSKSSYFYIFAGVGVSMILARNLIGLSYKLIAFILVNNMILMDGLFNYSHKVKEANIADYVDRMQYSPDYDACNPVGHGLISKLYWLLYKNQCLTYHKNMQINRADSIFPLESILNSYAFYLVEIPCKILGSGINAFAVNVNSYLPAIVRQLGGVTTQFCVMGFLVFVFVLYFASPRFTIAFLGARLHINFGRFAVRPEMIRRNSRQYRRIQQTPRSTLNEIENKTEGQPSDHTGEGSHSTSDDVEDEGMMIEEIQENSSGEDIEVLDDEMATENESQSLTTDEKNFTEDVETADELLDELRTDNESQSLTTDERNVSEGVETADERNVSEGVETADELLDELKTDE